jgi:hypothetical protein
MIEEIFKLGFSDKPDYEKIKFYLLKCLLDINELPNKVFDWNKRYVKEEEQENPNQMNDEDPENYDIYDNEGDQMSNFPCVSDLMK